MNTVETTQSNLIVEKLVSSWKYTDKHPCPKCGVKLGMPYKCEKCNTKAENAILVLLLTFCSYTQ